MFVIHFQRTSQVKNNLSLSQLWNEFPERNMYRMKADVLSNEDLFCLVSLLLSIVSTFYSNLVSVAKPQTGRKVKSFFHCIKLIAN